MRFNPWAFISLLIQPTVNSFFGIVFRASDRPAPLVNESDVLYFRYDVLTYFSILISFLLAWMFFDAKRLEIIKKYEGLPVSVGAGWGIIVATFVFWVFSAYLYTINYFLNVTVFCSLLLAGQILLRRWK